MLPSAAFKNPELAEPVGVVIDGDRIYGYVATWGVCHIGIPGKCEMAPKSPSNYAYFRTGTVATDEGPVSVGQITMDTGHAAMDKRLRAAAAHYDNTGAVVADIVTGEDLIGIWFSGLIRPGVTDEQRHALAAAGRLSGDWRQSPDGQLELVAALAVNVPGFPIPRPALVASGEDVTAVVAMGVVEDAPAVVAGGMMNADEIAAIVRTAVEEYADVQEKRAAHAAKMEVVNKHRAELRARTLNRLRAKISE